MIKAIINELIYFALILIILAFIQHSDLLHSPMHRIGLMAEKENYLHPLLWTSVVYVIVVIFRLIVRYFIYLKNKGKQY